MVANARPTWTFPLPPPAFLGGGAGVMGNMVPGAARLWILDRGNAVSHAQEGDNFMIKIEYFKKGGNG